MNPKVIVLSQFQRVSKVNIFLKWSLTNDISAINVIMSK
jgi:hypothetical protein